MVIKDHVLRYILATTGLLFILFILLSDASNTSKSIGVILSMILLAFSIIVTSPLRKFFDQTKEGRMGNE